MGADCRRAYSFENLVANLDEKESSPIGDLVGAGALDTLSRGVTIS